MNDEEQTVDRIDPSHLAATPFTIGLPDFPSDLTVGNGSILVALGALAEIVRINPEQNEATEPIPALGDEGPGCGQPRASIAFGDGDASVRVRGG